MPSAEAQNEIPDFGARSQGRTLDRLVTIEPGPYPTAIFGKVAQPVDQAIAADYGAVADVPRKVFEGLANSQANSQEVTDRVVQLIETPAGSRPVRSLVGSFVEQFQPVNDSAFQMQTAAQQPFGLSELMTLAGLNVK